MKSALILGRYIEIGRRLTGERFDCKGKLYYEGEPIMGVQTFLWTTNPEDFEKGREFAKKYGWETHDIILGFGDPEKEAVRRMTAKLPPVKIGSGKTVITAPTPDMVPAEDVDEDWAEWDEEGEEDDKEDERVGAKRVGDDEGAEE